MRALALYSLKRPFQQATRDRVAIDQSPYLLVLKHCWYMPGKIAAVMEQTGKLDFFVNVAVEHKMTWGFHPFAGHPFAAEHQMIDIGVRRKVGARLCAWTCWLLQHVA